MAKIPYGGGIGKKKPRADYVPTLLTKELQSRLVALGPGPALVVWVYLCGRWPHNTTAQELAAETGMTRRSVSTGLGALVGSGLVAIEERKRRLIVSLPSTEMVRIPSTQPSTQRVPTEHTTCAPEAHNVCPPSTQRAPQRHTTHVNASARAEGEGEGTSPLPPFLEPDAAPLAPSGPGAGPAAASPGPLSEAARRFLDNHRRPPAAGGRP
jgi:hypothetical protein